MPEATFLHIRSRDDAPVRVIELPVGPIRIGRGPLCEVRLADPDVADVQCMLRRRGATWHYQPVGPPGRVWIDGRPADHQRPLPVGVSVRIADHWLTLRSAERSSGALVAFDDPPRSEAAAVEIGAPPPEEVEAAPTRPGQTDPASPEGPDERLRRWQSRLDQRDKWLRDRQEEKRWEARWKAAGESIRSRAADPSKSTTPPTRPTHTPPPVARPSPTPPATRPIEPRPAPTFRRIADPGPRPSSATSRVPIRPTPPPVARPPAPAAPPPERVRPAVSTSRALVALPAPTVDGPVSTSRPVEDPSIARLPDPDVSSPIIEVFEPAPLPGPSGPATIEVLEIISRIEKDEPAEDVVLDLDDNEALSWNELEHTFDLPVAGESIVEAFKPAISQDDTITPELAVQPASFEDWVPSMSPVAEVAGDPEPESFEPAAVTRDEEPYQPGPLVDPSSRSRAEWPSAREIFASQGVRGGVRATEPARPARRKAVEPSATDIEAPSCWAIPTWLGLIPTAVVALAVGTCGLVLACTWTLDGVAANGALKLAIRDEKAGGHTIPPSDVPRGGWWKSTAAHNAAWAIALTRAADGEDHSEEIRSLLEAARHASPLSATTRFAIEPPAPDSGEPTPDLSHLGRSRDVITLTWAGRRLARAGKHDAAVRAYRAALEIAARARIRDLEAPSFDEDQAVHRYRLPRESMMASVYADMIGAGEWAHEQWVAALPDTAMAPLVASRALLRAKNRAEADRLNDLAIARGEGTPAGGLDPAEHHAAAAEALAARLRWADAATQYQRAIERSDHDPDRRRWWLNLAEIARHIGDDATRARAIEAAKSPDSNDEITRRALGHQQTNPGLAARGDRP